MGIAPTSSQRDRDGHERLRPGCGSAGFHLAHFDPRTYNTAQAIRGALQRRRRAAFRMADLAGKLGASCEVFRQAAVADAIHQPNGLIWPASSPIRALAPHGNQLRHLRKQN